MPTMSCGNSHLTVTIGSFCLSTIAVIQVGCLICLYRLVTSSIANLIANRFRAFFLKQRHKGEDSMKKKLPPENERCQ
jgi:hypothetical protein